MTNKSRFSYIKSNFFLKNRKRPSQSKVKARHGDNTQSANPQHSIECKTKTQNVFFRFLSQNEKKVVLLHPLSRGKESQNGLLAQLVQSASFTRKRSTVRICNRPPRKGFEWSLFYFTHRLHTRFGSTINEGQQPYCKKTTVPIISLLRQAYVMSCTRQYIRINSILWNIKKGVKWKAT